VPARSRERSNPNESSTDMELQARRVVSATRSAPATTRKWQRRWRAGETIRLERERDVGRREVEREERAEV
jgi:hypothetical protein